MARSATVLEMAGRYGVKVGALLVTRLGNSFGASIATLSTEVLVVNTLPENLVLMSAPTPRQGIWTSTLPDTIKAGTVEGYGCESHGFMTGIINASATYKGAKSGTVYNFTTSKPYMGAPSASAVPSDVETIVASDITTFIVR